MDNGLELTADGYVLHPKRTAYRTATLVGVAMAVLGIAAVGLIATGLLGTPTPSRRGGTLLAMAMMTVVMGSLAFVGWFTSLPPTLVVTRCRLSLIGGAHRRREDRSHIVSVYRGGAPAKIGLDRSYFVVLSTPRAITIPVRHFDATGLEDAMRRLDVPISGDFTSPADEIGVKGNSEATS